jgi:hypothetical protein
MVVFIVLEVVANTTFIRLKIPTQQPKLQKKKINGGCMTRCLG